MEGTSKSREVLKKMYETDEEELELTLSMNGTFGVDPASKKLKRSSSISHLAVSGAVEVAREEDAPLVRASSVPADYETEMRRRKAEQTARRLEVRKKMNWKKSARAIRENNNNININININNIGNVEASEQVVVGSQKSDSPGVSDQLIQGATPNGEEKSPSSVPSVEGQVEQVPLAQADAPAGNGAPVGDERGKSRLRGTPNLFDMPYVSTMGGGNMISGFLYSYERGVSVQIMCVCHGQFLTPAEFVRHGGGGDVENPLKHIMVNRTTLF